MPGQVINKKGEVLFVEENPGAVKLTGSIPQGTAKIGKVQLESSGGNEPNITVPTDAMGTGYAFSTMGFGQAYNDSTWDRLRNNTQGTLLASAARTATANSPTKTNYNAKGVLLTLDVTISSGTGGLQVRPFTLDPVTGKKVYLSSSVTSITATGTYGYEFYPGSTTAAGSGSNNINQRIATSLPRTWGVDVIAGDGTSYTYSLGYQLIL